jgi:soluble lytic murein transglycosylase
MTLVLLALAGGAAWAQEGAVGSDQRELFTKAWLAAREGDRADFEQLRPDLEGYLLYPYWQYEDYRFRRSQVPAAELSAFLDQHAKWAFSAGLRKTWLKSLGEARRWQDVYTYGANASDTELRCQYARALLELGKTEELLPLAKELWAVGHSQPGECDKVLDWLVAEGGISTALAWKRIRLAMAEGNPRFTLYLARFLPSSDQPWLRRWQDLNLARYRQLERLQGWPDTELTRMITSESLKRLANHDAMAAMRSFRHLDGDFSWGEEVRGDTMRQIALMAAVDLEPEASAFIRQVPRDHRNDQLMQWWVRLALSQGNWAEVDEAISAMSPTAADDARWRYWQARARMALGYPDEAREALLELAGEANYYGFLAADDLGEPYSICPIEPETDAAEMAALRSQGGIARALELRAAGLDNWALSEWTLAALRLPADELRTAAAVAWEADWHDRAIFALGDSGDLRWYDWRFPLLWEKRVMNEAGRHDLDPAWIYGVMRAESAMTESAKSGAGARGLMQVTPATAKQISKKHGLPYRGTSQLLIADENIQFGSVYLRELMDRYQQNPVLVSAAYNAGPNAVTRWLDSRPIDEAAVWAEILSYHETRDYIPRVLAFTTIYDWRLKNAVPRVSSRMPGIESGNMRSMETTQVVCRVDKAGHGP